VRCDFEWSAPLHPTFISFLFERYCTFAPSGGKLPGKGQSEYTWRVKDHRPDHADRFSRRVWIRGWRLQILRSYCPSSKSIFNACGDGSRKSADKIHEHFQFFVTLCHLQVHSNILKASEGWQTGLLAQSYDRHFSVVQHLLVKQEARPALYQALNQLGTPEGRKSFLGGAQIL